MNIDSNPSEIENELKKLGYWDNLYSKNDYFGTGQTILANFAKDVIEKNSIKNMLELGCGQGRDSVFFAKLGCNIVAIDISENAIKFVERTKYDENLKNLQLVISDIQKSLNFIWCIQIYHYNSLIYLNLATYFQIFLMSCHQARFSYFLQKKLATNIIILEIKYLIVHLSTKELHGFSLLNLNLKLY